MPTQHSKHTEQHFNTVPLVSSMEYDMSHIANSYMDYIQINKKSCYEWMNVEARNIYQDIYLTFIFCM